MRYLIQIQDTKGLYVGFVVVGTPVFKVWSDWFESENLPTVFDSEIEAKEALNECQKQFIDYEFKFTLIPVK